MVGVIVAANHEFGGLGSLLGWQAESFLGDIVSYALYLDDDAAGGYWRNESFGGYTFTFTHADFGGLLGDGFVGKMRIQIWP